MAITKITALAALLALSACATCEHHPVACSVAAGVVATSIALSVDDGASSHQNQRAFRNSPCQRNLSC